MTNDTLVYGSFDIGFFGYRDLVFILVSTPNSPLSKHGHILLLVSPIIEGALGGWSTLQATTSAYISDCTSSGSRAHIFSRFTGVTFLGIFLGPTISGYLIQRSSSNGDGGVKNVTSVFWVAVVCSFLNFLAAVFVFPESLDKAKREKAREEWERVTRGKGKGKGKVAVGDDDGEDGAQESTVEGESVGLVARLISPLSTFLPAMVRDYSAGGNGRLKRDWSLTVLAVAFFCYQLCVVSVVLVRFFGVADGMNRGYINSSICTQSMCMDGALKS